MKQTVLLSGATGCVGQAMYPALRAAGHEVRCGSRSPERARARFPDREWVRLDVEDPATLPQALEGCAAALFLVHGMGEGGDYPDREARAAEAFARAAERANVQRVVYLGGPEPLGHGSRHLRSRLHTGQILRAGAVPCFELRAAMILGKGSAGWQMFRDLSRRLPAMVLPRWLTHASWPVALDDVVAAVLACLELPLEQAGWYDLPGPERVTYREMLRRCARAQGRSPWMIGVPLLSPRLSSYWIAAVADADFNVARELVLGAIEDLDPSGPILWDLLPDHPLTGLDAAIQRSLINDPGSTRPTILRSIQNLCRVGAGN